MIIRSLALALTTAIALSPAFAAEPAAAGKGRVLLVASSTNQMTFKDGRTHLTGYYLDELAVPAQAFIKAGYDVVIATPDGNTPALDANSINAKLFGGSDAALAQAMRFVTTYPGMQKPSKLGDVVSADLASFDGIYVPGGHAPMVDLMQDKSLGKALSYFHAQGKVTALLCHGPVALISATTNPSAFRASMVEGKTQAASSQVSGWPYAGYAMTVYSTAEEKSVEKFLGGDIQFYMEDALRAAGGKVSVGAPDKPFLVEDRELITGQNPSSDHLVAEAVLRKLDTQAKERRASMD